MIQVTNGNSCVYAQLEAILGACSQIITYDLGAQTWELLAHDIL